MVVISEDWENFVWVGPEIITSGLLRVADDWRQVVRLLLEDIDRPLRRQDVITDALHFIKKRQGGTKIACRHIADGLEGE